MENFPLERNQFSSPKLKILDAFKSWNTASKTGNLPLVAQRVTT